MTHQRDWQYELRREFDGRRIDRAMEYHVLERAAIMQIKIAGLRTGRNYLIVHLPTGQVVSRWARSRIEGEQTWGWIVNYELIRELERTCACAEAGADPCEPGLRCVHARAHCLDGIRAASA